MIRYAVLGSGSSGNSYIISYNGTSILLDAGFSLKQIKERVAEAQLDFSSIQALFITHLHPDHARGAGVFARQTQLPVYVDHHIGDNLTPFASLRIPPQCIRHFKGGEDVVIGDFVVSSFSTSHDSPHSVGFLISVKGRKFLLLTDTGMIYPMMNALANQSDVLFLEANYDISMLENGPYPYPLRKRISGVNGHLSNNDAIDFLNEIITDKEQHVYFCHLSKTNNEEDVLLTSCKKRLRWKGEQTICRNGNLYASSLHVEEGNQ